jgi:YVTN family beta-propeller protein
MSLAGVLTGSVKAGSAVIRAGGFALAILLGVVPVAPAQAPTVTGHAHAPAGRGRKPASGAVEHDVRAVLPNGREIRPEGGWIALAPYPFAIALRRDGSEAAVPSIGFPFALNVIGRPDAESATVRRMPDGAESVAQVETHAGLAYSPDGSLLYVATGESGRIAIYKTGDWTKVGEIALDGAMGGRVYRGSFAATLIVSSHGRWIYVLDQGNWRVAIVDVEKREVVGSVETGAYPFGLTLSPDEKRLYVTNSGLFEYTAVEDADTGLRWAPYGYPSKAAREGVMVEGKRVAGLGDENSTRGSSVWTYGVEEPERARVTAKLRMGERIAGRLIGGAAPTGVAADGDAVYVSLAHQDSVVKVSADGTRTLGEVALSPFTGKRFVDRLGRPLRGVMPSGMALRDGRLYVAEAGIDAVGVIDTRSMQVVELIPAGWNPSAVAVAPDGRTLYVVNTKGRGTGANGGAAHGAGQPSYIGSLEYGSLGVVRLDKLGPGLTQTVVQANSAAIDKADELPRLKHCFLVIRENRTFDEILGDVTGVNGDVRLARYGMQGWAEESKLANGLRVTPNLHAMVAQFATSDNFYVDSEVSADGHRWVMGINPTPFFNTAWTSNYGGRRSSSVKAEGPGRRAMFGGDDGPMPEDEPQFGSLWEHVAGSGKGILNYGEGLEIEGDDEIEGLEPEGQRLRLNAPVPEPVFESSDRRYPTFNLGIPDQYRAAEFEQDMRRRIARNQVPALVVIRLPNDHTAEPRPSDGYPYRASYVADNDLALGKIVAFLSRSSLWKDSAVFVTEDDAQGGVDHVDAHRSVLVIASPWVRAGAVSHEHASMGSITRTIDELLGLGAINLEDALAGEIGGVFGSVPASGEFEVQASDARVFAPEKARAARPKTKAEAAKLRDMDDPDEIRPQVEKSAHPGKN